MFEKLKDEFWTFCEITDRKSSILYLPMIVLLGCMGVGAFILKLSDRILETQSPAGYDSINHFAGMISGFTGLGMMVFGFIVYFVLTHSLYQKEKKRLSRIY